MPTLSMFFGIVIRVNPREHNPPHFHAQFQDCEGSFDIATGEMTVGDLDTRQQRLVQAWWEIHKDELRANWDLIQNGEAHFKINPLQ